MSVNSKMTAIADKIRAIRGTSDSMGLDAMATNLGTVQTNINSAFTAIGNKGGTVPSAKISGNLESAINSISSGAAIKELSGNVSASGTTSRTVNLGFKPDAVIITISGYPALHVMFKNSTSVTAYSYNSSQSSYPVVRMTVAQTSTGFTVSGSKRANTSLRFSNYSVTANYYAVKYNN